MFSHFYFSYFRAIIDHVKSLFNEHGGDCWWNLTEEELIPKEELAKVKNLAFDLISL